MLNQILIGLFTAGLWLGLWSTGIAQEPLAEQPALSSQELAALIQDLEDPAARARLIQQLKALAQAEAAEPPSEVQHATLELLQGVSQRLGGFRETVLQLIDSIAELPWVVTWLQAQASDPLAREFWIEVLITLALVLGLGKLVFYGMQWLLARPYQALTQRPPGNWLARVLLLLLILLLNLLPIAALVITAYLFLGLISPQEQTRLVALAWINASAIAHLGVAVGRLVLAPTAPGLRLPPLSDATAGYIDRWLRRLIYTTVYGYMALQALLLLGLPLPAYQAMRRLLGLVVAMLVILLIMQNRTVVAAYIRGREPGEFPRERPYGLRDRLAQVWYLLAVLCVVVLYGVWTLEVIGGFWFLLRAIMLTLLIMALGHMLLRLLEAFFKGGFQFSWNLGPQLSGLQTRANRYVPIIHTVLKGLVYGLGALAILQAWGVDTFEWLSSEAGRVLGFTAITVIGIVVVSFAIWEVASSLIENYLAEQDRFGRVQVRSARTRTLLTVIRNALFVVLAVLTTLLILAELGINITPLLAGAGVLGLAVGFGSQKLVQDVITGIFILFEDLISVGDVVDVGDKSGLVEAVSIRNVRLRDLAGTVHTIPYSAISTISNLTRDFSFYVFDVGVGYQENVDTVMEVLKQIGTELQKDAKFSPLILAPLEVLGVDAFADSAVIIKARIKTLPIRQWDVGREFNRRMKQRFDELGIEIPFPHRTLYFGIDKQGQTSPLPVQLNPSATNPPSVKRPADQNAPAFPAGE